MSKKPIKLNILQSKTLALFQELAKHPETATRDDETGEVTIAWLPRPHGDHVHVGDFVISSRDASGFFNENVWRALERKGLARSAFPVQIILTRAGLAHDTGAGRDFERSDH